MMNNSFLRWLASIYFKNGRFTSSLIEDLSLVVSTFLGFRSLLSMNRNPADGFFDGTLTFATLSITAMVMIVYHLLWRILETMQGLEHERLIEQVPRFFASGFLVYGLYNFSKNVPEFLASLVLFYFFLVLWHVLISPEMRKARGTIDFDFFGLLCAIAFAWFAFDLYEKSKEFWQTLPNYANDPLSADVVRRSFAGKQTNLVYMMGLFAGAMVANAILAFSRGLKRA